MSLKINHYMKFLFIYLNGNKDLLKNFAVNKILDGVKNSGYTIEHAFNRNEVKRIVKYDTSVGCFLIKADRANAAKIADIVSYIRERGLETPVYIMTESQSLSDFDNSNFGPVSGFICLEDETIDFVVKELTASIIKYTEGLHSPFFGALLEYNSHGEQAWTCPGHQGGMFFKRSPAGRLFFQHMGESIFRDDLCNAQVSMGDLMIHQGPALAAQAEAAKIYGSDRTYFVMNGTSSSNKVVNCAILSSDDLVLFDRNNHKSNHQGALFLAGAIPIYLDTDRNSHGMIGAINWESLDEKIIRERIKNNPLIKDKNAWKKERPFRLAIIEQCTYDGTLYNARKIYDKIAHLCDYILFDEAWAGFGKFHPLFKDHFAMGIEGLDENSPGVIATQSTHKMLAGFSQASQIHVKDNHIKKQHRRVEHRRFNEMFMLHASTSPFYPLFASLDVCAQMHKGKSGQVLWDDTIRLGIEIRKKIRELEDNYKQNIDEKRRWFFDPFVPNYVSVKNSKYTEDFENKIWHQVDTNVLTNEQQCWTFKPGVAWHGYKVIEEDYAMIDPNKLMLLTPGIDRETGEYTDFGVPASILANFLRENHIVPEKCDLNSILFLMTPGVETSKASSLISYLVRFKDLIDNDAPMHDVVPEIYSKYRKRYAGYTIRQLCQEMHDFYKAKNIQKLQKESFAYKSFPEQAMTARDATNALTANKVDYIPLSKVHGRIAATLALIYPPGIGIVVPGERYDEASKPMLDYFFAFQEAWKLFPGFSNEIQGVYEEEDDNGNPEFYTYVVREDYK